MASLATYVQLGLTAQLEVTHSKIVYQELTGNLIAEYLPDHNTWYFSPFVFIKFWLPLN